MVLPYTSASGTRWDPRLIEAMERHTQMIIDDMIKWRVRVFMRDYNDSARDLHKYALSAGEGE